MDVDDIWYGRWAIGDYPKITVLNFLQSGNTNMVDEQTCVVHCCVIGHSCTNVKQDHCYVLGRSCADVCEEQLMGWKGNKDDIRCGIYDTRGYSKMVLTNWMGGALWVGGAAGGVRCDGGCR
jgi:hypothetical protein